MTEPSDAAGVCGPLAEPFPEVSTAEWRARVERELGDGDFDRELVGRLPGGLRVEPLYTESPSATTASWPAPSGSWLRCAHCELPTQPSEIDQAAAEEELAAALAGGCTGVVVAPWVPSSLASVLSNVNLGDAALFIDSSRAAARAAELARAICDHPAMGRFEAERRTLGLGVDPLTRLLTGQAREVELEDTGQTLATLPEPFRGPRSSVRALAVSSRPLHEAGAHPAQELGWTLAALAYYLRAGEKAGWTAADLAGQVEIRVAMERDSFVGIAKLRGLRSLWTRLLAACGVTSPPAALVHAFGSERSLTRRSPRLNLVRGAAQTLSAVCGGADAISAPPWDRVSGGDSAAGRRLARNTQLIASEEAHLGRCLDPAAGSYYLESLTDRLARAGWEELRRIEASGGAVEHFRSGRLRAEVHAAWEERAAAVRDGGLPIVGVTVFPDPGETVHGSPRPSPGPLPRRRDEGA